jgi:hypothetical protein
VWDTASHLGDLLVQRDVLIRTNLPVQVIKHFTCKFNMLALNYAALMTQGGFELRPDRLSF